MESTEARENFRVDSLGCDGGPYVQAVMLYAVAKAIGRPVAAMPRPEPDQLWSSFKAAIDCKAIALTHLPLPLLSFGERFALAVGTTFCTEQLPTGETFLEITDAATEIGTEFAGKIALSAILRMHAVRSVLPSSILRLHGERGIAEALQYPATSDVLSH